MLGGELIDLLTENCSTQPAIAESGTMTKQRQTINNFIDRPNVLFVLKLHPCDNLFQPDFKIFTSLNRIIMSTPVDASLTGLKASTAKIMALISGARQIPPGSSHFALTSQVGALVVCSFLFCLFFSLTSRRAHVVKEHGEGPLPGLVLSCSRELMRVRSMTPQV